MTISTFIRPFRFASRSTVGGGRLRRYLARHRLNDEERKNLRDYYRRSRVQSPAIMTASLGGHRPHERGER